VREKKKKNQSQTELVSENPFGENTISRKMFANNSKIKKKKKKKRRQKNPRKEEENLQMRQTRRELREY
jgi:hypothetical protein